MLTLIQPLLHLRSEAIDVQQHSYVLLMSVDASSLQSSFCRLAQLPHDLFVGGSQGAMASRVREGLGQPSLLGRVSTDPP